MRGSKHWQAGRHCCNCWQQLSFRFSQAQPRPAARQHLPCTVTPTDRLCMARSGGRLPPLVRPARSLYIEHLALSPRTAYSTSERAFCGRATSMSHPGTQRRHTAAACAAGSLSIHRTPRLEPACRLWHIGASILWPRHEHESPRHAAAAHCRRLCGRLALYTSNTSP